MNIISQIMKWLHSDSPQYSMTYMLWFSDFYLHSPVILSYIWKPIWHMNIVSPDYEMVWHNDLPQYSMTYMSWFSDFYLHSPVILSISESPFDIWTSYLQIIKWYDTMIHRNMNVVSIIHVMVQWFLPSWSSDLVLYLKAHMTYEHHKPIWHMKHIFRLWNVMTQCLTSIWM